MRPLAAAIALAVAASAPALPADLGGPKPALAQTPSVRPLEPDRSPFSGPYVGGAIGYSDGATTAQGLSIPASGWSGALIIGSSWVVGNFMLGIEGDLSLGKLRGSLNNGIAAIDTRADWLGSIRARAGVAIGPTLLYTTGGIVLGHYKVSLADAGIVTSDAGRRVGIAFGGGLEHALSSGVHLRGEVLRHAVAEDDTLFGVHSTTGSTVVRLGATIQLSR